MKTPVKVALWSVLILGLGGLLTGLYLFNKPHKNLRLVKPDYVVTAVDLQKEFEASESVATAKYLNKRVEVRGIILLYNVEGEKVTTIIIRTQSDISNIICNLGTAVDKNEVDAEKPITIRGEVSGFLMDVLLNNCVIMK